MARREHTNARGKAADLVGAARPAVDTGILIILDGRFFHPNGEMARNIRSLAEAAPPLVTAARSRSRKGGRA